MRDLVSGATMFAVALGLLMVSRTIPNPGYDILGPAFLPQLTLWVILALSAALILGAWLRRKAPVEKAATPPDRGAQARAVGVVVLLALFILSINLRLARFEILAAVYLFASGMVLLPRRPDARAALIVGGVAVIAALIVGYLFKSILHVNLP